MAEFPVEDIPNSATLFFRIQRIHVDDDGHIVSVPFGRPAMSVNWDKYSTPAATAAQALKKDTALVLGINAGFCRDAPQSQSVIHVPIQAGELHGPNQAHSEVQGKKTDSAKGRLRDHAAQNVLWTAPSAPAAS